jgi:hypothetical protein
MNLLNRCQRSGVSQEHIKSTDVDNFWMSIFFLVIPIEVL